MLVMRRFEEGAMLSFMSMDTQGAAPAEFVHLGRREKVFAMRSFDRWNRQLTELHPLSAEANRRQALNLAYISLARRWLSVAGPIGFIAGCFWSFRDSRWADRRRSRADRGRSGSPCVHGYPLEAGPKLLARPG